jgi:hypothetical protein
VNYPGTERGARRVGGVRFPAGRRGFGETPVVSNDVEAWSSIDSAVARGRRQRPQDRRVGNASAFHDRGRLDQIKRVEHLPDALEGAAAEEATGNAAALEHRQPGGDETVTRREVGVQRRDSTARIGGIDQAGTPEAAGLVPKRSRAAMLSKRAVAHVLAKGRGDLGVHGVPITRQFHFFGIAGLSLL